eukprot:UN27478
MSNALAPLECIACRAGSLIIVIRGSQKDIDKTKERIKIEGIRLPSFGSFFIDRTPEIQPIETQENTKSTQLDIPTTDFDSSPTPSEFDETATEAEYLNRRNRKRFVSNFQNPKKRKRKTNDSELGSCYFDQPCQKRRRLSRIVIAHETIITESI